MSDTPMGEGWWLASDGKYYPPQAAPATHEPQAQVPATRRSFGKWLVIGVGGFFGLMLLIGMVGAAVAPPEEETALKASTSSDADAKTDNDHTPEPTSAPPAEAAQAAPTTEAPKPPPTTVAPTPAPPTTAKPTTTTEAPRPSITVSQANAQRKADSYLDMTGFSRLGLIEQLEFEGFSTADATFGVDALMADWNKQAARKADSYLDMSPFSRTGLIKQLEFEGFANAEATHGTDSLNADWNEQAAKKAKDYLAMSSFSRSSLVQQLEFEGFTHEQAEYGATKNGL